MSDAPATPEPHPTARRAPPGTAERIIDSARCLTCVHDQINDREPRRSPNRGCGFARAADARSEPRSKRWLGRDESAPGLAGVEGDRRKRPRPSSALGARRVAGAVWRSRRCARRCAGARDAIGRGRRDHMRSGPRTRVAARARCDAVGPPGDEPCNGGALAT